MDVYKYQQSNDKLGLKSHEDFEQIEFVLGKEFENTPTLICLDTARMRFLDFNPTEEATKGWS